MLIPPYKNRAQRGKLLKNVEKRKRKHFAKQIRELIGNYYYYARKEPVPCRLTRYPTDQELAEYW